MMKPLKDIFTIITACALALAPLCGCQDMAPQAEEHFLSVAATVGGATKGTPLTAVPDAFSVWGYVWPSSGAQGTPDWMCGETFTKDGTLWKSARRHGNIPPGYSMRLWAQGPVGATGVSGLPLAATTTAPGFSYICPASVAAQQDVIVAYGEAYDVQPAAFPLAFRHALSCVLFRTSATSVPACTVKSITVSGLRSSGTYAEGAGWSALSGSASYVITPNKVLTTASVDVQINNDAESMILVPQTIPAGAKVTVVYDVNGTEYSEDADIAGIELPMGYKVVLRLELPDVAPGDLSVTASVRKWTAGAEFNAGIGGL